MGNGVSKKRNCKICNGKIYDKSGKEKVVIDHVNYCREKSNNKKHIDDLKSEIYQAENRSVLYQRTYAIEVSKLKNEHTHTCRTKDSEIERLKTKIKNQTDNLNGIDRRHRESLHKTKELGNQITQLQRQGLIKMARNQ